MFSVGRNDSSFRHWESLGRLSCGKTWVLEHTEKRHKKLRTWQHLIIIILCKFVGSSPPPRLYSTCEMTCMHAQVEPDFGSKMTSVFDYLGKYSKR